MNLDTAFSSLREKRIPCGIRLYHDGSCEAWVGDDTSFHESHQGSGTADLHAIAAWLSETAERLGASGSPLLDAPERTP